MAERKINHFGIVTGDQEEFDKLDRVFSQLFGEPDDRSAEKGYPCLFFAEGKLELVQFGEGFRVHVDVETENPIGLLSQFGEMEKLGGGRGPVGMVELLPGFSLMARDS